jgi:hypothetical protein
MLFVNRNNFAQGESNKKPIKKKIVKKRAKTNGRNVGELDNDEYIDSEFYAAAIENGFNYELLNEKNLSNPPYGDQPPTYNMVVDKDSNQRRQQTPKATKTEKSSTCNMI